MKKIDNHKYQNISKSVIQNKNVILTLHISPFYANKNNQNGQCIVYNAIYLNKSNDIDTETEIEIEIDNEINSTFHKLTSGFRFRFRLGQERFMHLEVQTRI